MILSYTVQASSRAQVDLLDERKQLALYLTIQTNLRER